MGTFLILFATGNGSIDDDRTKVNHAKYVRAPAHDSGSAQALPEHFAPNRFAAGVSLLNRTLAGRD
jgi:hypothetical protein